MAKIEKTFTFTVDTGTINARAAASAAMTPEQRCRAMMARITSASSRDLARGRVW